VGGSRLPTEAEWESATVDLKSAESELPDDDRLMKPRPAVGQAEIRQLFGEVWQWTGSAFLPYPGFRAAPGAVGEYNGKFMSGQFVLRGSSCATPPGHARASYRNFFYPHQRWQFTGVRLAKDL
jgi:formylglycine-generating enzyme required for sulfatase activity